MRAKGRAIRVFAAGLALLLVLGGCSKPAPVELSETEVFGGSEAPPAGDGPTTQPTVGGPSVPGGEVAAPRPPAQQARPGSGGQNSPGGGAAPPPPQVDARRAHGPPGSFAPVLLREDLTVEVLAQSGAEPSNQAYSHLVSTLSSVAGRQVGRSGPIKVDGGARAWTADELKATADSLAIRPPGSATIRTLFLHGTFNGNEGVLGVAVRGDVMAIFIDQVRSTGGLVGDSSGVERAVLLHEAGHVLGLVDLYLDTGRADPEHPGHSKNRESVMYWAVESTAIAQVFGANPPDTFDDADRADLARIKSGK